MPNIVKEIVKRRWVGHAWHKQGALVKRVIEEDPIGKIPLGKSKLRWEDCVEKKYRTINQSERSSGRQR